MNIQFPHCRFWLSLRLRLHTSSDNIHKKPASINSQVFICFCPQVQPQVGEGSSRHLFYNTPSLIFVVIVLYYFFSI